MRPSNRQTVSQLCSWVRICGLACSRFLVLSSCCGLVLCPSACRWLLLLSLCSLCCGLRCALGVVRCVGSALLLLPLAALCSLVCFLVSPRFPLFFLAFLVLRVVFLCVFLCFSWFSPWILAVKPTFQPASGSPIAYHSTVSIVSLFRVQSYHTRTQKNNNCPVRPRCMSVPKTEAQAARPLAANACCVW